MIKIYLIFFISFFTSASALKSAEKDSLSSKTSAPHEGIISSGDLPEIINDNYTDEEPEEILLLLKYSGVINTTIPSIYFKDNIYLPLKNLAGLFKIIFNESGDELEIVYQEKNIIINIQRREILFADSTILIKENDFFNREDDFYLKKDLVEKKLQINIKFNFNNLSLNVESKEYLPVYKESLREQNYAYLRKGSKTKGPLLYPLEKKWLSGGVIDYNLSSFYGSESFPFYTYQFNAGGEAAGGELRLGLTGNFVNNKPQNDFDYYWNYVLNEDYLTRVTIGNQFLEGLNSYLTEAITLTNEPVTPRKLYGTFSLADTVFSYSTVELYVNDKLFDYIKTGVNGGFNFDFPVTYGTTAIKLISYDTHGNISVRKSIWQVPPDFNPEGDLNYKLSFGRNAESKRIFLLGNASMGLTSWLTNTTGIEYIENLLNETPVFYNSLQARFLSNFILELSAAPEANYTFRLNGFTTNLHSFNLLLRKHQENKFYNPSQIKNEAAFSTYLPFNPGYPMNINFTGRYVEYRDIKNIDYNIETSGHFGNFHPSLEFRGFYSKNLFERYFLSGRILFSLPFIDQTLKILKGNILSFISNYNFSSRRMEGVHLSYAATLLTSSRIQLSYFNNLAGGGSDFQLQLITDLPFTRSTTFTSGNMVSQSFQGSLNYDSPNNNFHFYNRMNIGKASAVINMFVDENGNNKYDYDEEKISYGKVILDGSSLVTNSNGFLYFRELNPYTEYSITIDEAGIKNPLLKPSIGTFSFIAEPNQVKKIDIPFYISGEISGEVYILMKDEKREAGSIEVNIENEDGSIIKTRTFSDGSFYYFGLKPDTYQIYIDPAYLKRVNKTSSPSEYKINMEGENNIISDLKFEIK